MIACGTNWSFLALPMGVVAGSLAIFLGMRAGQK